MARGLAVGTIENNQLFLDPAALAAFQGGGAAPGPGPQAAPAQGAYQPGYAAAPAAPTVNWLEALSGGAQMVAGLIRDRRLNFLSDTVRDKRDALDVAKLKVDAMVSVDPTKTTFDAQGTAKAQAEVDTKIENVFTAQADLDRAQNQAELWSAGFGAANLGAGLGYGQGYGVPYGWGMQPGYGMQQPAYVPSYPVPQGYPGPGYPMMGNPMGGMGPFLGGFTGGALGGALGSGAFTGTGTKDTRP